MTSAVLVAVAVTTDGKPPAQHLPAHRSGHQALSNHTRKVPHRAHTDTDDRTTIAASALDHHHDAPTTTVTTTASNHDPNPSRHWHPAVPFPGAAVTGAAEAAKAAPC